MVASPTRTALTLPREPQRAQQARKQLALLKRGVEDKERLVDDSTPVVARLDLFCRKFLIRQLASLGTASFNQSSATAFADLKRDWASGAFAFSGNYRLNQMCSREAFDARFQHSWDGIARDLSL
ncbi:MAG TPA: hypothetical protein VGN26_05435 [Armatimonadota bacterium]|jgi:hypothetical protein